MYIIFVEFFAKFNGDKLSIFRLWKMYKKINLFTSVLPYFTMQQWQIRSDAVLELWNRMNPTDRQIFYFNIDDLDWETYLKHMIPGLRVYLIKDPMNTLEVGRAKYKK